MIARPFPFGLSRLSPWRLVAGFIRDCRGASLVELAFAAPILMLMLAGTYDMAQYVLLHQKLNRAASSMADLVSQSPGITASEVDELFFAAQRLLQPYDLQGNGHVIVSSISRTGSADPLIDWQRQGGGTLSASSELGSTATVPALPTNLSVRDGENLIAAEVFFTHQPLLLDGFLPDGVIRHEAFRRARLGNISTLN